MNGPIPPTKSSLTGPSYEQKVYISSFLQTKEKFQQDMEFRVDFDSAEEAWKGFLGVLGGMKLMESLTASLMARLRWKAISSP